MLCRSRVRRPMPNPILVNYSITYPKCGISKEHAGELLAALEDVRAVVVAQETHQDGDTHLHAFVQFKKKGAKRHKDLRP